MKIVHRSGIAAALVLPVLLAGCSLFPTKRHLPVPKTPAVVQTTTPDELVKLVDQRWDALTNLTATVEIAAHDATKDYPSCRGFIVMRRPNMLRVAGTYFGVKLFDMASDGSHFTLVIPSKSLAIEGSNAVTEKSANQWENLRPGFFLDAIAVRGLDPEDEYMVASDSETVEDAANKHLYVEPEYVLSVMRRKNNHENLPVRTVTFHRDDMMPYDQYIYDKDGTLDTQIFYSNYVTFSAGKYPSKIVIRLPQEKLEFDLAVDRVEENVNPIPPDSQFQVKIPEGTTIRQLK